VKRLPFWGARHLGSLMSQIPKHIAIIMDGNGRWAKKRFLPRVAGHVKGVNTLKKIVTHCDSLGVRHLTVFAFGRENWNRPVSEVSFLMRLMLKRLNHEINELHQKNAIIKFIGDKSRINSEFLSSIQHAEDLTHANSGLNLNICLDYSGQYDIVQAINRILAEHPDAIITEELLASHLLTAHAPDPELVIRTSGECRISNFMLWQLAYSEIYFTSIFWPDFSPHELDKAITWYQDRERRFGKISEQL
jgi:undecaprenyl diphosphate synthase